MQSSSNHLRAPLPACLCLSSMGRGDADFLRTVSQLGCEVHSFDPSKSNASGSHLGNSLASNHGNGGGVIQHKMWLEWRAPKRRRHKTRGNLGSVSQTLADIMAALGHHTVRDTHLCACTRAHRFTGNFEKHRQTNIPWSLFYPNIPRKLFYLAVTIATGLCAISGCHGNSLSEWITQWPSYIWQPQEGVTHLALSKISIWWIFFVKLSFDFQILGSLEEEGGKAALYQPLLATTLSLYIQSVCQFQQSCHLSKK